jgi:hypothetical protein
MMMGLIPAPEPKFKLSNFMKVLGDQAIAGKAVALSYNIMIVLSTNSTLLYSILCALDNNKLLMIFDIQFSFFNPNPATDPSKVELRVLQQMRQRQLNHEMRNISAKLTPAERKAKRIQKLQEDTTRQVHVAAFRIKDFTDPKHRFKVDVNAQQHFLTGTGTMKKN